MSTANPSITCRIKWLIPTSYNVTPEELFDLFGKFGPIRLVISSSCWRNQREEETRVL